MLLRTLTLATLVACLPAFAGEDAPQPAAGTHAGAHHQKLLDKFDANHDGKLDDGERATARAALAARLKEKHPELLAKIDTNGDGVISEAEMKAARTLLKERRHERHAK